MKLLRSITTLSPSFVIFSVDCPYAEIGKNSIIVDGETLIEGFDYAVRAEKIPTRDYETVRVELKKSTKSGAIIHFYSLEPTESAASVLMLDRRRFVLEAFGMSETELDSLLNSVQQ